MFFTGALSYADDITISCPRIVGLNNMLKICNIKLFALHNSVIFNSKKTVCLKFGDKIIEGEETIFNGTYIQWADSVRRLDNYIDLTYTDMIDCKAKRSCFKAYVNK